MFPRDVRIESYDPELAKAIAAETQRQEDHVELIASENYTSPAVMEAQGSQLTNKYAEGYPGKRYYGGCEYVDIAEQLAIDRLKQLFGADYANVQPHSGSQANQAVYFALLQPGDTILGMSLAHGGHLTHGAKVNASGKLFNAVQYGVNDQGLIDYDEVERLALEHKPKMVVAGFSAYSQVIDWARFRAIADKVGAYLFVDMAHVAGLVAAGVYPSPLEHAHVVTSTTHKTLRGPRGGIIVAKGADEDLVDRLAGLRDIMEMHDLDAVVLTSMHNVAYYSGFLYCSFGRPYACVVTKTECVTISAGIDAGQPWRRRSRPAKAGCVASTPPSTRPRLSLTSVASRR